MPYSIWIREPGQTIGRTLHAYEVIESGRGIRLRVKFADDTAGLLPLVIEEHGEAVSRLRQIERCSVGGGIPEIVEVSSEPGQASTDPAPWRHVDGERVSDPGHPDAPQGGYTFDPREGYSDHADRYISTRRNKPELPSEPGKNHARSV